MKNAWTFLLLTCASPAFATDSVALCPLVDELNGYLTENTDFDAVHCPAIGFSTLTADGTMRSQAGAYFPETGRIELAPDLDLTTAYGKSFLLHEMVHAAQFAAGEDERVPCHGTLEAEAYRVQAAYQREAGLTREAMLTDLLAVQLGGCGTTPEY